MNFDSQEDIEDEILWHNGRIHLECYLFNWEPFLLDEFIDRNGKKPRKCYWHYQLKTVFATLNFSL